MAMSRCVAVPRMVPAYSSFLRWSKGHKLYSSNGFALTQPAARVASPISLPQAKASRVAVEIIRTIPEKNDAEVQEELNRVQNACEMLSQMLKGFVRDIFLVLVAVNPILRLLSDAMVWNDRFLRQSSIGAAYGALLVLNGFIKILFKSQPIWGYKIIMGYLIYKANMRNIALYRKGHRPVWLVPLFVLVTGVFLANCLVPMICSTWMPVNVIWVIIEGIASSFMMFFVCALIDYFDSQKTNFLQSNFIDVD